MMERGEGSRRRGCSWQGKGMGGGGGRNKRDKYGGGVVWESDGWGEVGRTEDANVTAIGRLRGPALHHHCL